MKLVDIKFTDGPNYWSIRRHRLVVMTIDLEEMEERPTDAIPGFYQRITKLLPSLYQHRCSEDQLGGFFHRVETGTWMGHVIEHIALEMQTLAGLDTGFGRTRNAGRKGLYHVVFSCEEPLSGEYAGQAAFRIARALIDDIDYDLAEDITNIREIYTTSRLGPSTAAIVEEARKRDIPIIRLNNGSLVQLGYGSGQKRIEAAVASTTSNIAVELAGDKDATKKLLSAAGIPVPEGLTFTSEQELDEVIRQIGYPIVLKPVDGNHGRGATLNITTEEDARKGLKEAKKHSETVICEKYIAGHDFRMLVVNYKFIAAALRTPATVVGDGSHTIHELVDLANEDPRRGEGHENLLTRIDLDPQSLDLLLDQGYSPDFVPGDGQQVSLKATGNLSTGGSAEDVTDTVHPANCALAQRVARLVGLDICGIDIIAADLTTPLYENGGVIIEVNAGPGLRMHLQPSAGRGRNVAAPIVDMLFPDRSKGRIPIIGITGTNGKTTTTRLIAHIGTKAGYSVGCTTTDGIYIDGQPIMKGDCTGPASARIVLKDPGVDLAVLECARGGILRAGLGFDQCNIAVITNIAEDHLGMQGIDTIDQLARLKGVLAEAVSPEGYTVLNADDPQVYQLREKLRCRIALFSMDADSPAIRRHVREGGVAAVYENGYLTLVHEGTMTRIGQADQLPITFDGLARFNISNALAASLAASLQGIAPAQIYTALLQFIPTPESIPGRMNIFDFGECKIIADYAHNTHGLQRAGEFIRLMPAKLRIGVIAGVGDRRDQDIVSYGAEAARLFDEIIIRQDNNLRGRSAEELNGLLMRGIHQVDCSKKVVVVPDEFDALSALISRAEPGMVGAFFADDIPGVLQALAEAKQTGIHAAQKMEVV